MSLNDFEVLLRNYLSGQKSSHTKWSLTQGNSGDQVAYDILYHGVPLHEYKSISKKNVYWVRESNAPKELKHIKARFLINGVFKEPSQRHIQHIFGSIDLSKIKSNKKLLSNGTCVPLVPHKIWNNTNKQYKLKHTHVDITSHCKFFNANFVPNQTLSVYNIPNEMFQLTNSNKAKSTPTFFEVIEKACQATMEHPMYMRELQNADFLSVKSIEELSKYKSKNNNLAKHLISMYYHVKHAESK